MQTQDVQVLFLFAGATTKVVALETGGKGVVPGSVKVKNKVLADPTTGAVEGAKSYVEGVHFTVKASEGTVTLRRFGPGNVENFQPAGVVVTIAYLVPPIVRPGPGESVVPAVLSIPSSAPPAAPKPVYAVPTFGWESKKGPLAGHYESRRRGRGLRVYLERPWWSSGEGELLGVVLDHPTANQAQSDLRDAVVTRVGVDPVFKSTATLPPLDLFDFTAATVAGIVPDQNGRGYQLAGVPGRVLVSGHEVGYDAARKLWFCDIQVDSSSYFPFIKLGLVRFQPLSVAGAHLSSVVVTDFHQLAPDRFVSVAPVLAAGPGTPTRAVTVTGQSYSKAGGDGLPPLVRVFVERLDPTIGTDLGWSQVGGVVTLEPKPPSGDDSVWGGQIAIPIAPAGTKQRLVIEELERHQTGVDLQIGERLVYSDVIEL